ncbi:MAG: ABC transporter permease [Clostridiales Family XIII bacterium]|jgi:teichoic acid transport system permease protein|nr:ABC transporter permease [Clostridiales Family XIII bacterium]
MKTLVSIIKDHFIWRHQILKLAKSDIIKTYSGSALGWAWAIIKPTILVLIFWFVFSIGLRVAAGADGHPYILWLISGLVPWLYMDEMITGGTTAFLTYSYLITKMKFPIATIPTFIGIAKLIVHCALMVVVILIFVLHGYYPDVYLLQLPIYTILMVIFYANWGLFAALFSAISKDFLNLVFSFTTAIFWMSGILFDVRGIQRPWVKTLLMFNPPTFIAEGYRNVFIYKVWIWEQPYHLLAFLFMLCVMSTIAVWSYKKLHKEIPDVL